MEALMANVRTGFVISDMHRTEIHPVRLRSSGVSKPRMLEFTDNPILQSGAVGLSKLVDDVCPHICKGLPTGTRLDKGVLEDCSQNLLDVIRFALTNEDMFLGSTKQKLHPTTFGVINYSRWVALSDGVVATIHSRIQP
jgi:hypothetical protein